MLLMLNAASRSEMHEPYLHGDYSLRRRQTLKKVKTHTVNMIHAPRERMWYSVSGKSATYFRLYGPESGLSQCTLPRDIA